MILDLNVDVDEGGSASFTADVCAMRAAAVEIPMAFTLSSAGPDVLRMKGWGWGWGLAADSQALRQDHTVDPPFFQNVGVGIYRLLEGTTLYSGEQSGPCDPFSTGVWLWADRAVWPRPSCELDRCYWRVWALFGRDRQVPAVAAALGRTGNASLNRRFADEGERARSLLSFALQWMGARSSVKLATSCKERPSDLLTLFVLPGEARLLGRLMFDVSALPAMYASVH